MNAGLSSRSSRAAGGFTLLEIIIAVSIMAIVLVAVNGALFAGIHLRNSTFNAIESALPVEEALQAMRRDLANLVISTNTNSVFIGPLQTINQTNTLLPGQVGPDFYTTRGELDGLVPWGSIEKIDYSLTPSKTGRAGPGLDLVRSITRNLLPVNQGQPTPEEQQTLLSGVRSVTFLYYDGTKWDTAWDTTQQTNLPYAIKVQILMAAAPGALVVDAPLELVVPVDVLLNTNTITPVQ